MPSPSASGETSPAQNVTSEDQPGEEGREEPVREKFEETTIEEQRNRESLELADTDMREVPGSRGRLTRKRSREDIEDGDSTMKHTRKRSREVREDDRPTKKGKDDTQDSGSEGSLNGTNNPHPVTSSNGSRSRHTPPTGSVTEGTLEDPNSVPKNHTSTPPTASENPDDFGARSPSKAPPGSGFANASSRSPFASLDPTKSAFAAPATSGNGPGLPTSGFASFSKISSSPFGTLSPTKPASTPAPNQASVVEAPKEKLSFTSASSAPSGFGSLASQPTGFGGALGASSPFKGAGTGGSLKSFASSSNNTAMNGFAIKPAKAFAFGGEDNEEDDDGDDGYDPEAAQTVGTEAEEKQDERFFAQDVETGEEGETTIFQCRAKLYWIHDNAWKERGVGVLKVNTSETSTSERIASDKEPAGPKTQETETAEAEIAKDDGEGQKELSASKTFARFIFRTDGSHRTMLNSPITKDVVLQDRNGGPPEGKATTFLGIVDGKPTPCLIIVKLPTTTLELVAAIDHIKTLMA